MKKQLFTFLALFISGIISAQVGIGTTTPTQALDIETNEAGGTAIDINNTGTGDPKINLQLNGTTTFSIGVDNDDADKLKIGTTDPETNTRVTINNTGNVGIGTIAVNLNSFKHYSIDNQIFKSKSLIINLLFLYQKNNKWLML